MKGSEITKYYFAGPASGQRIAMRTPYNNVSFLLSDHLGSTSLTTDSAGNLTSEMRYTPWGETRFTSGTSPTNYRYTGQRQEASFGLYFYNARWYDSSLGRFAQADTIIPGGVQGYDRYAYVNNNPINASDPTGHKCVGESEECLNDDGSKGGGFTGGNTKPNPKLSCGVSNQPSCGGKGGRQTTPPNPDWGKFIVGDIVLLAGELTMLMGGFVMASAYVEIGVGIAAAPATFTLSAVIALIHAPVELAIGGIIFSAGVALAGGGVKLMLDSGVPAMIYNKLNPFK